MDLSTDSSTSTTQIAVEYDEVDGPVASRSKSRQKVQKTVKKSEKPQRPEKFVKATGSGKRLPKHQSSVN